MKNINKLPKFMPGQVIDLSYKFKGLPNRLLIKTVFIQELNDQWMYDVYLENIDENRILSETFITDNMTHKSAKVYTMAEVVNLYNSGWRFCGNFNKNEAQNTASQYAVNKYIRSIILKPALDNHGSLVNNKYGIWVKYNSTINSDGTIVRDNNYENAIIIK